MKRKIIINFLAATFAFCSLGVFSACGEAEVKEPEEKFVNKDGFSYAWRKEYKGYELKGLENIDLLSTYPEGKFREVELPKKINGVPVTSIGTYAFQVDIGMESIVIPDSVTRIESRAFAYCPSLKEIKIGDGVRTIGEEAFRGTLIYYEKSKWENDALYIGNYLIEAGEALEGTYEIKPKTKVIAYGAFTYSQIESVIIPDSVVAINGGAFYGCTNLTEITIPKKVTEIGYGVFDGCENLSKINLPSTLTSIGMEAFTRTAYFNNEKNWEDGVLYIDKYLIQAKNTVSGAYQVKDGTKVIAEYAFSSCESLTSLDIPKSVLGIGSGVFQYCIRLQDINFAGKKKDWLKMKEGKLFDARDPQYTVHCKDGDIPKEEG